MKKTIKYIVIACIVGIIIYVSTILFNQRPVINNTVEILPNSVQLIITPEYDEYLYNQKIWMVCKVINNTPQDYLLKEFFNWETLNFQIIDPNGNIIKDNNLDGDQAVIPKPVILSPGEVFETVVNLDWYFASRTIEESEMSGIYEIYSQYQDLRSNKVNLDMMAPEGVDEELYEKTSKTNKLPIIPHESWELQNLLEEYPTSKYAPQLYNVLFLSMQSEPDSARFFDNLNNFITNYKNSFESYSIIEYYESFAKKYFKWTDAEIEYRISSLVRNNPDTKFQTSVQYRKNKLTLFYKMKGKF